MLKFFSRLIFSFFSNFVALLTAGYFVKGFEITPDLINFSLVAGVFTLINVFIRPILKFILSPVIVLTFGLGVILVNALTLYLLDFFLADIVISGLKPLFYATLIISLINILIGFSAKRVYKE
jgi:putative membrane protein